MENRVKKRAISKVTGIYAPIFDNALRLLEDARILRSARRYPSAAALAILSLEELGKFLVNHEAFALWVTPLEQPKSGRPHSHKQKQRSAAEALTWVMGVDEIETLIAAAGYSLVIVKKRKTSERKIGPTLTEIISSIDDETYNANVGPKLRNRRHHKLVIELMKGNFDQLKQAGFYVDLQKPNSLVPIRQIDRFTADGAIKLAGGALHSTRLMLSRFNRRTKSDNVAKAT
jgi:AbiV family abortive infection protein